MTEPTTNDPASTAKKETMMPAAGTPDSPTTTPDGTNAAHATSPATAPGSRRGPNEGDIVWADDPKSRQWTSGGLRGRFVGKHHAWRVLYTRPGPGGSTLVYGKALCGVRHHSRLGSQPGPHDALCKRCERIVARADAHRLEAKTLNGSTPPRVVVLLDGAPVVTFEVSVERGRVRLLERKVAEPDGPLPEIVSLMGDAAVLTPDEALRGEW